jgi:hypothetical protein
VADLTYDTELKFSGLLRKTIPFIITNAVQLYTGMFVKLVSGYATKMVSGGGAAGAMVGVAVAGGVPGSNPVLDYNLSALTPPYPAIAIGNVTTAAAGNANQVIVETGEFTLKQVTLTLANGTLAGTAADVNTKVYAATSNPADMTNTQSGSDKPVGLISAFYSATATTATYDVLVNSYDARSRGN